MTDIHDASIVQGQNTPMPVVSRWTILWYAILYFFTGKTDKSFYTLEGGWQLKINPGNPSASMSYWHKNNVQQYKQYTVVQDGNDVALYINGSLVSK